MLMLLSPAWLWLLAGALLIVLEVTIAPTLVLFLAGLSALTISLLLGLEVIAPSATIYQVGLWALCSGLYAVALWKPLKRWRFSAKSETYHNIVGGSVRVISAITKQQPGSVEWSGTTMRALLDESASVSTLEAGETGEITAVKGTILYIKELPHG